MASSERNGRETPCGFYVTILPPINTSGNFRINMLKKFKAAFLNRSAGPGKSPRRSELRDRELRNLSRVNSRLSSLRIVISPDT